jgi:hypothetical protein
VCSGGSQWRVYSLHARKLTSRIGYSSCCVSQEANGGESNPDLFYNKANVRPHTHTPLPLISAPISLVVI